MPTNWQKPRTTLIERLINANLKPKDPSDPSQGPVIPFVIEDRIWPMDGKENHGHDIWFELLAKFTVGGGNDNNAAITEPIKINGTLVNYGSELKGSGSFGGDLTSLVARSKKPDTNIFPTSTNEGDNLLAAIVALVHFLCPEGDGDKDGDPLNSHESY